MKNYYLLLSLLFIAMTYSCKKDETSGSGSGGGDSQMMMKVSGDTVNYTYSITYGDYQTYDSIHHDITLEDTVENSRIYFSVSDSTFPSIGQYSHLAEGNLELADLSVEYDSSHYFAYSLDTVLESSVNIARSGDVYTIKGTFNFSDYYGYKSKVEIDYSGILSEIQPY